MQWMASIRLSASLSRRGWSRMVDASLVVPAHNEEGNIQKLVDEITKEFHGADFSYEIIIVDDNSTDKTGVIADKIAKSNPKVRVIHRKPPGGFGRAVKDGLKAAKGETITLVMGDLSDDPKDIIKLIKKAREGYDVIYGSRFVEGGSIEDYPIIKLICNRMFNHIIRLIFNMRHKDITNAFKLYRKELIDEIGVDNIKSEHFDITVEIPVKAHKLKAKSVEVPVRWHGRKSGVSKLKLSRMGVVYLRRLRDM